MTMLHTVPDQSIDGIAEHTWLGWLQSSRFHAEIGLSAYEKLAYVEGAGYEDNVTSDYGFGGFLERSGYLNPDGTAGERQGFPVSYNEAFAGIDDQTRTISLSNAIRRLQTAILVAAGNRFPLQETFDFGQDGWIDPQTGKRFLNESAFFDRVGLPDGFRRAKDQIFSGGMFEPIVLPNPSRGGPDATDKERAYGVIQDGDIIGPWLFEDIERALSIMRVFNPTPDLHLSAPPLFPQSRLLPEHLGFFNQNAPLNGPAIQTWISVISYETNAGELWNAFTSLHDYYAEMSEADDEVDPYLHDRGLYEAGFSLPPPANKSINGYDVARDYFGSAVKTQPSIQQDDNSFPSFNAQYDMVFSCRAEDQVPDFAINRGVPRLIIPRLLREFRAEGNIEKQVGINSYEVIGAEANDIYEPVPSETIPPLASPKYTLLGASEWSLDLRGEMDSRQGGGSNLVTGISGHVLPNWLFSIDRDEVYDLSGPAINGFGEPSLMYEGNGTLSEIR